MLKRKKGNKTMKKTLATIMMITMIFTSMPLSSEAKTIHVKSITLTSVNVEVGEKSAIIMHVKPANATEKIQLGIYTKLEFPAKVAYKSKKYFKNGEIIGYATGTKAGTKTTQLHFYIYDGKKNRPTLSSDLTLNVTSPKGNFFDDEDDEEWDDEEWDDEDEDWDYDDEDWDDEDEDWDYDDEDWDDEDEDWDYNDEDWDDEDYDDSDYEDEGDIEEEEDEEDQEPKIKVVCIGNASIKSLKAGKKNFTIKVNKLSKNSSNGYQIRYSLKKNMKKSTIKIISNSNCKVSKKIKGLKKKKKYYVQVRTIRIADGHTYYSAWSKTWTVKTK